MKLTVGMSLRIVHLDLLRGFWKFKWLKKFVINRLFIVLYV